MPYEYEHEEQEELSFLDVFETLWNRKWLIIFTTAFFGIVVMLYSLTLPLTYRGECRILPPGGSGSTGVLSQLGSIADLVGLPRTATSGQMLLGVLRGDTVVDAIIDKFNLMEELEQDIRMRARNMVLAGLQTEEDVRSGIISVAYVHKDPQRAADMANAFVAELQKKLQEISINSAQQRRTFFENQLLQAQQELNTAEEELINYQQSKGVIALESQTGALLASINSLRNRIAAKNVEISTLSSYARRDNPRLRLAQSELDAMNKELRKLEEEQQRTDRRGSNISRDLLASVGQVPELGVEYQRYMRTLQFAAAKYELMLRQYETARLNEANDISTIQIVDPAKVPDYKYRPRRAFMTIIAAAAGMFIGIFWAFLAEHIRAVKKARRKRDDYDDYDDE